MNNKLAAVIIIATGLLGWGSYWFFDNYERTTKEINTGYSGEALLNNYLAAIRFLKETGHEVDYKSSLLSMGELPATKDVLIIPTRRFDVGPEKVGTLIDWLKSGGHLIVQAFRYDEDSERTDHLLSALGVYVKNRAYEDTPDSNEPVKDNTQKNKTDKNKKYCDDNDIQFGFLHDEDSNKSTDQTDNEKPCEDKFTVNSSVTKGGEKKKVRLGTSFYLDHNEEDYFSLWTVEDENGIALLELGVGEGRITILNSMRFMSNFRIAKNDHASFLWHMVNTRKTQPKVWLILNDDMPPLYKLISKHAKYAVISFFILLLLWIIYAARRFGPKMVPTAMERRQLSEHIHASGNFLWQQQEQFALIEASKQAIMDTLAINQPHWAQLSKTELIDKLASQLKISKQAIHKAFNVKHSVKELEFIQIMQTLSAIRNQL